jgi:uncharacterized repeat protein (TIGR03803 family)
MKTKHHLIQVYLLTAGLLGLAPVATAQTYTVTKSFTNILEGGLPNGLILGGSTLYGTTQEGGSGTNYGTVFKVNTDGTGYTVLKSFTNDLDGYLPDGSYPYAGLTLYSNVLYGTTEDGGSIGGGGTVFKINTDGTGFIKLKAFGGDPNGGPVYNGTYPSAPLTLCSNVLYGTSADGGYGSGGTVFKINTDGSCYTVLHPFSGGPDGAVPLAGVTLCSNVLYGTTVAGGSDGYDGTIYKVNTDGTGYAIIHNFTNNPDGAAPTAGLTLCGNVLYGTTSGGGSEGRGTIFQINTDGTGFAVIKYFTDAEDDGDYPKGGLTLVGNVLYGTATEGDGDFGTVFAINTDGTGYTILKDYTGAPNDGSDPQSGLILSGSTLYGTTSAGGDFGGSLPSNGTLFSISLVPSLAIAGAGNQAILSWPIWAPNFSLQSTTNLASPVWTAITNAPVVIDTNNLVTNCLSGDQRFYRLSQ